MLERGDVARMNYKWPRDDASRRDEGHKERPCTVLEQVHQNGKTIAVLVVPHHGILRGSAPRDDDLPYAIRLPQAAQRALGLLKLDARGRVAPNQKESWVLAHHANYVQIPNNPSVLRTLDSNGEPGWSSGKMPEAILRLIDEKRALAKKHGKLQESLVMRSASKTAPTRAPRPPEKLSEKERRELRDSRIRAQVQSQINALATSQVPAGQQQGSKLQRRTSNVREG